MVLEIIKTKQQLFSTAQNVLNYIEDEPKYQKSRLNSFLKVSTQGNGSVPLLLFI